MAKFLISDTTSEKSDSQQTIITSRLANYVRQRIQGKKVKESWCIKWAATNFAQMAVILVICDHM